MSRPGLGLLACLAAAAPALPAAVAAAGAPRVETNEAYVAEAGRSGDFDVADMQAVFAFVLASLPDRVKVYPTENYYYFSFHHGGVRYAGNIRLENELRDQGKVHFAYGIEGTPWRDQSRERLFHVLFGAAQGVTVEKLDRLVYRIGFRGRSVVFELNDLAGVVPPAGSLAADERYLGPIFDESGIRFFFVYNPRLKLFHYLLDETVPVADQFFRSRISPRIEIGKRTGFAFYRDRRRQRKILIGVFEGNVLVNNYFDGPFDQLPDNFIEGEALRAAILDVDPGLKGRIDRYGSAFDGQTRFLIAPYLAYRSESDLAIVHRCAAAAPAAADRYYRCFALGEDPARRMAVPAGKKARPPARAKRRH